MLNQSILLQNQATAEEALTCTLLMSGVGQGPILSLLQRSPSMPSAALLASRAIGGWIGSRICSQPTDRWLHHLRTYTVSVLGASRGPTDNASKAVKPVPNSDLNHSCPLLYHMAGTRTQRGGLRRVQAGFDSACLCLPAQHWQSRLQPADTDDAVIGALALPQGWDSDEARLKLWQAQTDSLDSACWVVAGQHCRWRLTWQLHPAYAPVVGLGCQRYPGSRLLQACSGKAATAEHRWPRPNTPCLARPAT